MSATAWPGEPLEAENLQVLLEHKAWFEQLLDLRTRELRRRERGGVLEVGDEVEEERALKASLDQRVAELDARVADLARRGSALPITRLAQAYRLSPLETRVLLLALLPAIDTGFRMRVARYKDNILFNYVDIDLVVNLFFDTDAERLVALRLFASDAPLVQNRLVRLVHHPDLTNDDLINQETRLPERVVNFLLGHRMLATHLAHFADLREPRATFADVHVPDIDKRRVREVIGARKAGRGQVFLFVGGPGTGKSWFAEAMATHLGQRLLQVDCPRWAPQADLHGGPQRSVDDVFQEAVFQDAVVLLENLGPVLEARSALVPALIDALADHPGVVVLTAHKRENLDAVLERMIGLELRFDRPTVDERKAIWRASVPAHATLANPADLDTVAAQFDLPGGYIRNAMNVALNRALARDADHPLVRLDDLLDGAHAQLRGDMTDFTTRSRIGLSLADLILPEDELKQVKGLLSACRNQQRVLAEWGFGKKLVTGRGIVALFTGEPGTGKTLCAEILANELGMQLYQVAIPKLVSKWIGETEKNIATVFSKARATRSMLLFDEADALFTNRVEVKTSTDRYSNLEVNSLLQEIERYDGIVLLTTNRDKDFDKAFKRRIMFQIRFPFPKPEERAQIWAHLIPPEVPKEDDLELARLARNFELAGGNIKNIILRAAYKAMDRGCKMNMRVLAESAEEESRSAGRLFRMPGEDEL